ncbi:MAG: uroporphyrinogen-III C-methyltransferase [Burkholderiales bacterium]|nr:uroporphyrinogen-III C-methyltransferase [Burkholderiales bacterium]
MRPGAPPGLAVADRTEPAARALRGVVHLVGAGPGAPDLLTLRALRLLQSADIVFHDALVHPDTVALAANAHKVAVGKRCGTHSAAQRFINKRLVDAARRYRCVVRLKGGDPMLFGRAQEEIDALQAAGIAVEVVPGVTAAQAAAADLGISLTRRGVSRSVAFATPRVGIDEAPSDWAASLAGADTGVLYMAAHQARTVAEELLRRGKPPTLPVAIVVWASLASRRRFTTLAALARDGAAPGDGPALLLVGEILRGAADAAREVPAPLVPHTAAARRAA